VRFEFSSGLEQEAFLGEGFDLISDHRRRTGCQHLEEIAIRNGAQPLVPWHVLRGEVAHVDRRSDVSSDLPEQESAHLSRPTTARQVHLTLDRNVSLACGGVYPLVWQEPTEELRDLVE